jgi:hypothetical protein
MTASAPETGKGRPAPTLDPMASDQLAERSLHEPHPSRLPADTAQRDRILAAHRAAMAAGEAGYTDPVSGLFVFTAAYHAERGDCCENDCRHCPYVR